MRTATLKDLFPRASEQAFPTFLDMGGYPTDRGKAGLLQNSIRGVILESTATWRPTLKPAALKRNHAHVAAEKLSQQHARLERLALVASEPESDPPLVGFRSAWLSEKPD